MKKRTEHELKIKNLGDNEDQRELEAEQDPREVALWEAHHKKGRRTFGKKRWDGANFGWGTTENSIASKVYGKDPKVLVSTYEGDTIHHVVEDYNPIFRR